MSILEPRYEQDSSRGGVVIRYGGNLLVARRTVRAIPHQFKYSPTRGDVQSFSVRSAIRMRRYLRECIPKYREMVTLTYPFSFPTNGVVVKQHLRRFIQECSRYNERSGRGTATWSVFWFFEFQARGAPHIHLFGTSFPPKDWVAKTWYRIVGSEDIRHLHAGTRTEFIRGGRAGVVAYASKYAAKSEQKTVPDGFEDVGRFWGVCGWRAVMSASTFASYRDMLDAGVRRCLDALKSCLKELQLIGALKVLAEDEDRIVAIVLHQGCDSRVWIAVSKLLVACNMSSGRCSENLAWVNYADGLY